MVQNLMSQLPDASTMCAFSKDLGLLLGVVERPSDCRILVLTCASSGKVAKRHYQRVQVDQAEAVHETQDSNKILHESRCI